MTTLTDVVNQIKSDEGYRQLPYTDTTGNLTVGYGRNLASVGIDQLEAEYLLRNDVIRILGELSSLIWFSGLNDARQQVIVNMAFNMGIAGLLGFKNMIAAIQKSDYANAAAEMLSSDWATQVGQRAVNLAVRMKNGV